jgi:AcrR family transcriptional regulator
LAGALKIAAREGLASLTIGRLATELHMSKSGLFAHFHSKQVLELATVEMAKEVFAISVLRPAQTSNRGIERLWNLCDLWLLHIERHVFPGAYFFTGALFEYAVRPGPVSKAIKNATQEWLNELRKAVQDAQEQKQIGRDLRAQQVAIELNGQLVGAYWAYLLKDGTSFRKSRDILLTRRGEVATDVIPASAFESLRAWKKHIEKKQLRAR